MNAASQSSGPRSVSSHAHGRQQRLLVNTFYAVVGNGFYHLCQLGVVILLAKFASARIQGQYFLGLAVATPIVLFFGFELRGALVADAGNQFSFGSYRTLRNIMMFPAGILLGGFLVYELLTGQSLAFVAILAGVFAARMVWSIAEVGWGTYQRRERLDLLATTVTLRGLALIIPFAILLPLYWWLTTQGMLSPARRADGTALAALLCAVGVALVYYFFDRQRVLDARYWNLSWSRQTITALAWQTFPLGVVALIITLCDSFPRILFEQQPDGMRKLGYFGSLAYITQAGNLIILQAATAASNRLALYYQRDLRAFFRIGLWLIGLALLVGSIVVFIAAYFGEWILCVLYTPDYARYLREFHIIVLAHCLALLTNVFGTATTQMRLFWVQVPVQVLTLAATVFAAVLLIPPNPVLGAAQTALVRAIVQLILYTACVALGLVYRKSILESARRTPSVSNPPLE